MHGFLRAGVATALALWTFASGASEVSSTGTPATATARVDAARNLFLEAVAFAREGQWARARDSYARSYALRPSPDTLYSLGVAQQHTGQWVEALGSFEAFLRQPEDDVTRPYRAPAADSVRELERRVARIRLTVGGLRPFDVRLDDTPWRDHATVERLVNPGTHVITVRAEGQPEVGRVIHVTQGQVRHVRVLLRDDEPMARQDGLDRGVDDGLDAQQIAAIGLLAGGGAMLVAGITTGLVGVEQASHADTVSEADDARGLAVAGDVFAVSGGIAMGVGLLLMLLDGDDDEAPRGVQVAALTTDTVGLRISF